MSYVVHRSSYTRRRSLDALQEDASTSHRRRRDKGVAEDVFESDSDLADWVRQACDAARGVVTAGLVGSGDAARDEALRALQEEVQQLRAREPSVVLDDGAAAKEIEQLKNELASLRRPSVEVGAELLGKYAGDGNWYDVIIESVSTDSARVRFRDYGNSEDVALSDLRAKGDDRDAVIAQLRAELAAQPRTSGDALRDTELASLRAELASYKDAEQRAALLEETVASQAEEIRRLTEARPDASAVFGAAPADAAGLFGAPPPADDGVVDELKKRIAELEANDASEALAARVAEAAQLQRRVQALEEENSAASTALQEANERLQTERAARKANEATLLEGSQQPVVDKSRRVRRKLRKQTSNFSRTMNELFDISDSILGELQAHEEDDSGDEDERVLDNLREKLPQAVDAVVARKVAEVRAPLEAQRDEAKKECDSAVDDLADLEERLFGAEKRLQEAEAVASQRQAADNADEDVVQALVQERDLLKDRVRELDAEPAKWEERLASLEERLREASEQRDAAASEREALREEVQNASTERDALRDGLRRVAEEADAGKAYEAQLEALKAQRDADKAEAVKEREAARAAYFVELEAASQKVSTLEAKLTQAEQALKDAQEREASLDEAVASQVDAEILRAENARLTEALASKGDDDSARCAELEELVRSAGAERDAALQRLAANDADAGVQVAEASKARDEALAAAAFAKTTMERQAADLAAASEQREALSQQCEADRAALNEAMQARDQAVSDVKSILEEFEGLRREASQVAAERDALKNDVGDARNQLSALEEAQSASTQKLDDEKRRSATLERELEKTETESRTTLDALERRVQKVDRQAVIAEEKSAFELDSLRKENSRLKRAKAKSDEKCAKLENASSQREGLMKKATKEASLLSERLQTVEAQIEERSRVIEQLRADAATWEQRALEAEASSANEERELEQEALEALRSTANEDAAARLAAEAERDSLREELASMRASHEGALQDLRSACERDVTESETARRALAEDVQAVEARVAEADRRCVGAEEAAAALSRDIDEERARVAAADALVAERDAALAALRDEVAALQSSSDDIAVGAELSGKFSGDGQFYDVVVEEVTETGYKVLFTEYGNSEELRRTDLKQRDNSKALRDLEARCAEAEARADRAEAALLENFDESESDAGDTLQEWRERCLRAEDAYAAMQKDGSMRDKLEAQERITAELHAKLADADQRYKAELSMREEAEAVVEELQTRPRTGTALDELAADLDEVQETLAEESERRQAAEAALAAKGGWSADLDRIRDAEARAEALGRELEDARLKAAALQAELDAPSELDALAGELRAEAAVATHLADLHPEVPQQSLEKFDEEWRQLEDEHNDLLALLAQQELEKTAMAELLSSRIGPEAVVEVKEKARVDCEARYGSYVDYAQEDVNALQRAEEELEGFVASAEEVVAPVM